MDPSTRCPCGSGDVYSDCCGRYHRGDEGSPTALVLMKSRFSAFAVGDADYLIDTWDPSTRPAGISLDSARRWTHLEIIVASAGGLFDRAGTIEFRAHYRDDGVRGSLHERSTFIRLDGRWLYQNGEISP
jgi:SEC-C motif-containing protein